MLKMLCLPMISLAIIIMSNGSAAASDRESELWGKVYVLLQDFAERLDQNDQGRALLQAANSQQDTRIYSIEERLKAVADRLARLWGTYPSLAAQLQQNFEAVANTEGTHEQKIARFIESIERRLAEIDASIAEIQKQRDADNQRMDVLEANALVIKSRLDNLEQRIEGMEGPEPAPAPQPPAPDYSKTFEPFQRLRSDGIAYPVCFNVHELCTCRKKEWSHVNMYGPDGKLYHGDLYRVHGQLVLHAWRVIN